MGIYIQDDFDRDLQSRFDKFLSHNDTILLGDFYITEDEYNKLKLKTKDILIRCKIFSNTTNLIVNLTLVNFAIHDYKLGHFWEELDAFLELENTQAFLKLVIEDFLLKYNLFFYKRENRGFKTSILLHAIIPNASINVLFNTLHDIYIKDLEEEYNDKEVELLLNYLGKLFNNYIENEKVTLSFQNKKITLLNYHLPISFRLAYIKNPKLVKSIIERILFYIDSLHYNKEIEYFNNDRFDHYFKMFKKTNQLYNDIQRKNRIEKVKKHFKAEYYLNIVKNPPIINLYLPSQLIDSEFINENIYIELYNDKKLIEHRELLVRQGRISFKTESVEIRLTNFYKNLKYLIKTDYNTLYDSKDVLYRKFILFDKEGNETRKIRLDESISILANNDDEIIVYPKETSLLKKQQCNYYVMNILLEKDTEILINDKYIYFDDFYQEKINKESSEEVVIYNNDDKYIVYNSVPIFKFRIPYSKIDKNIILEINGKNFQLTDVADFIKRDISDGSGDKIIQVNLYDKCFNSANFYKISFRYGGESKNILECNLVILNELSIEFDKNLYVNEFQAVINKMNFNIEQLQVKSTFPITINIKKATFSDLDIILDGYPCILRINVPIIFWKLNNEISSKERIPKIWHEFIEEDSFKVMGYPPYTISSLPKNERINAIRKDDNCKIYNVKDTNFDSNTSLKTIVLESTNIKKDLFKIYYNPVIDNLCIENCLLDSKGFFMSYDYIGPDNLNAELLKLPDNISIKNYVLNKNSNIFDKNLLLKDGDYKIVFKVISNNTFFNNTEKIIKEVELNIRKGIFRITDNNFLKSNISNSREYNSINCIRDNILVKKCVCRDGNIHIVSNMSIVDFDIEKPTCFALFNYSTDLIKAVNNQCVREKGKILLKLNISLFYDKKDNLWGRINYQKKLFVFDKENHSIKLSTVGKKELYVEYILLRMAKENLCH